MSIVVTSNTEEPKVEASKDAGLENKSADKKADNGDEVEDTKSASASADETAEESDALDKEDQDGEVDESKLEDRPKKSKNGFKRRIDKLNSKLSLKDQEIDYWRQEALRTKSKPEEKAVESKPKTDGRPKGDDFDTHTEFVEALTDWRIEQRDTKKANESRDSQLKSEHETLTKSHTDKVNEFKKDHDDFEEVMEEVADFAVSATIEHVILSSDVGPAIMYELAKDKKELERINKLSPLFAARELGKIEARVQRSSDSDEKLEIKTTKTPAPIKPVGTSGSGSKKRSISDPEIPQVEYEALRREQMKQRKAWG